MATVTASSLSLEKTLEELITEFNNLRTDVSSVTLETLITAASSTIIFEGATNDAYETTLAVVDPTADRTITFPNVTGTVITTANSDDPATTTTAADLDHFLINDGGTIKKMTLATALSSLPALLPSSANANALGSATLEWSDLFLGDGSVINFGNSQDVTLTHVADVGLTITHVGTGDNLPIVLQLKSEEDAIIAGEVIASLEFAAGDSGGTDAATVAAGIHAIAEGTFAADANATKLVFTTGVSETAASSATAKMTLSSAGLLTIADDLILKDAATIGVTSSTSAIGIASTGIVTFVDDILIKDVGTIGSATTPAAVTIAANGGITLSGTLGVTGVVTANAGVVVDNFTLDGTTLALSSGDFTLDVEGDISLDANGGDIRLKDNGTLFGTFSQNGGNLVIKNSSSETTAISIAGDEVVTFADDILIKDAGTIGNASVAAVMTLASTGIVTFVDDILIKNAGTIGSAGAAEAISISSAGVVGFSATTEASATGTAAVTLAGGLGVAKDVWIGDDVVLDSDGAIVLFGDNQEITLTHVHNVGLTLTHTATGDNLPVVLQLKSEEDAIIAGEVIASLEFAAGDSGGTDAATVAAGIHAIAEGTFAADANATKLVFTTGVSETAASSATAKATLSSIGDFQVAGDLVIKDGGTIGVASVTSAITIDASGNVTAAQNLTVSGNLTVTGTTTQVDTVTMNAANAVVFEGATADNYETTLTIVDPTADRIITLPNLTGTVVTTGDTATVTATMLAANSVDSSELVNGSIDAAHMSANSIDSDSYVDASIDTAHYAAGSVDATALGADCVTAAKIGDNVINSEHYAAGSIDEEHMSANSIDSDSYVDASIDTAHYAAGSVDATALGADCVTAAKIGDNVIDSEHYAADSIDEEHLANDCVGSAELKTLSTLLIKNAAGSTLKTLYGAGA